MLYLSTYKEWLRSWDSMEKKECQLVEILNLRNDIWQIQTDFKLVDHVDAIRQFLSRQTESK